MTVFNYETYQSIPNSPPQFCTLVPDSRNRYVTIRKQGANEGISDRKINSFHSQQLGGLKGKDVGLLPKASDPHFIQRIQIKSKEYESSDLVLILWKEKPGSKKRVTFKIEAKPLLPGCFIFSAEGVILWNSDHSQQGSQQIKKVLSLPSSGKSPDIVTCEQTWKNE